MTGPARHKPVRLMKTASSLPAILFIGLAMSSAELTTASADEQTRSVQSQLKDQGFYYGDLDGKSGPELSAAIRRYQIRNGLEVSGSLNKETVDSLSGAPAEPARTKAAPAPAQPKSQPQYAPPPVEEAKPRPQVNLHRNDDFREGDRRVLEEETGRSAAPRTGGIPPPAALDGAVVEPNIPGPYSDFFAGTPYATAPRVVQEGTMRRAQQFLADRGFYREPVDGAPGPATEEAVLTYQRNARIPLTGRLDLQTLASLRLLPGRGVGNPPLKPFYGTGTSGSRPVYRGVWVN